jgi:TatA/E family protein of Tat protein translocase
MDHTLIGFMMPGPTEMIIIGVIMLLLFGTRLPKVARSLGSSITEFKKGVSGVEEEVESIKDVGRDLERTVKAPIDKKDTND